MFSRHVLAGSGITDDEAPPQAETANTAAISRSDIKDFFSMVNQLHFFKLFSGFFKRIFRRIFRQEPYFHLFVGEMLWLLPEFVFRAEVGAAG